MDSTNMQVPFDLRLCQWRVGGWQLILRLSADIKGLDFAKCVWRSPVSESLGHLVHQRRCGYDHELNHHISTHAEREESEYASFTEDGAHIRVCSRRPVSTGYLTDCVQHRILTAGTAYAS